MRLDALKNKLWLVWQDDSPIFPEKPLVWEQAVEEFKCLIDQAVSEGDPFESLEIRQCSYEEMEWAGVDLAPEEDEDE